ncbi:MADF domain-containing protein [Aphis craccivora]|uniref:MADF domain-containing protein n=1 Tax=Aphis craccivora TaxID=307492 RepID=A0A6G0VRD2_APHCR|nr:MADF domain-containing protein [Aphis craccivora]
MPSGSGASSKKRKWYLFDNMLFLSDYMLQHKKMESNLSSPYIDQFENDSFVDEPLVPDPEENQETAEQEVLSQTIDTEDVENEKSSNEPIFKKPRINRKMLPSERVVEPMLEFIKTRTQSKKNNEDSPEHSFFKSIIPDYLKLNDKNQRQFKKIVLNTIDQLLDSQEDNTLYSNEMLRYNNAPHTNVIPHLSPDQQFNANNQPQQFNAIQYIACSPDLSSSDSSSSYLH